MAKVGAASQQDLVALPADYIQADGVTKRQDLEEAAAERHAVRVAAGLAEGRLERPAVARGAAIPCAGPLASQINWRRCGCRWRRVSRRRGFFRTQCTRYQE